MEVFIFDWLAYGENIDKFRVDGVMPRLGGRHFNPQAAIDTYARHIEAWVEAERLGFDGVGVNEHHGTPFGLMNSPNIMAAAMAQATERMKILIYGNLLPLHQPLRLAEELSMLDCLSKGRLIAGVARGAPREYGIYNVPMAESRSRFEECFEIMRRAWTEDVFSFEGQHYSYKDVSIWPRPVQQPHPPIWVPVTSSKETIEWAAANDVTITPGVFAGPMREDTIRYYAECQARHGRKVQPKHISIMLDCYVADSKAQAIKEYEPYLLYFFNTLLTYDQVYADKIQKGYFSQRAFEQFREGRKGTLADDTTVFTEWTSQTVRHMLEFWPVGTPDECAEKIIAECDEAGAQSVLLVINRGGMPQEMYLNQIRRIGEEVLPRLQRHKITSVKFAEGVDA